MKERNRDMFEDLCETIREFSNCMEDFLYVYDLINDRYYISPAALKRFSLPSALFTNVSETHKQFVYEKDYGTLMLDLQKVIDGVIDSHNLVYRWTDHFNKPIWINCRGKSIRNEEGKPLYLVGCINELGRYPVADETSGLLTNIVLKDFFGQNGPTTNIGFIMCISIDDLHHLNEWDEKMKKVSVIHDVVDCIHKEKSESQMVYRLLRDQFVIVDYESNSIDLAKDLYNRIHDRIKEKIVENEYRVLYTISAGIVSEENIKKLNYKSLLYVSQFMLDKMKEQGPSTIYCYDEKEYKVFIEKRRLLSNLRKAMLNQYERFELFFQPIVKGKDKSIYGAESLLRFYKEGGSMVSPGEFIPLLESSGLIIPIGRWILSQALAFCKECRKQIPDFRISVNISYIQVLKSDIVDSIQKALKQYDLPANCLIVELTESGHLENSMVVNKVWKQLKELGVSISIDDFGTGYSNLSSIGLLRPNTIKLDRGFTVKATKNEYEYQLMRHIIEVTHSLDLMICMEGVETREEVAMANGMDVDLIQGFYFGKPCRKIEFIEKYLYK